MRPSETVEEARVRVVANLKKGMRCPCCGQLAKKYKRHLNWSMARALIWLVRASPHREDGWVDLADAPKFVHESRELAKLAHWKLIEEKPAASKRGARCPGIWRPTARGIRFAKAEIALSSWVMLYDNRILEFSKKPITIIKALGKKFNFDELWRGIG